MPLGWKARFFSSGLSTLIFMRIFLSLLRFSKSNCTQKPSTMCGWQLPTLCVLIINSVYIRVPSKKTLTFKNLQSWEIVFSDTFQQAYVSIRVGEEVCEPHSCKGWEDSWGGHFPEGFIKTSLMQQAKQQLNGRGAHSITLLPWWRRNRSRSSRTKGAGGWL